MSSRTLQFEVQKSVNNKPKLLEPLELIDRHLKYLVTRRQSELSANID